MTIPQAQGLLGSEALQAISDLWPLVEPWVSAPQRKAGETAVPSWGLGPVSYDVRVSDLWAWHESWGAVALDPMTTDWDTLTRYAVRKTPGWPVERGTRGSVDIGPGETVHAETVETFDLPRDIMALPVGKSTYTRWGLQLLATPFEPGWKGRARVAFHNAGPRPITFHLDGGAFALLFFRVAGWGDAYAGRYQDQGLDGGR